VALQVKLPAVKKEVPDNVRDPRIGDTERPPLADAHRIERDPLAEIVGGRGRIAAQNAQ
jgi:hypothetical protein